jgi:hypothetical protein
MACCRVSSTVVPKAFSFLLLSHPGGYDSWEGFWITAPSHAPARFLLPLFERQPRPAHHIGTRSTLAPKVKSQQRAPGLKSVCGNKRVSRVWQAPERERLGHRVIAAFLAAAAWLSAAALALVIALTFIAFGHEQQRRGRERRRR